MEIKGKQKIIDKYYKYLNPKVLWSIIGVLMIVVISASLAWFRLLQEVDSVQMCRGSEVRGFCIPSVNNDPATNWKTYKSADYGFELKYPQDWEITIGSRPTSAVPVISFDDRFTEPDIGLTIASNCCREGLIKYKQLPLQVDGKNLELTFYGYAENLGAKIIDPNNSTRLAIFGIPPSLLQPTPVALKTDGVDIELQFEVKDEEAAINLFKQILSTFKFTSVSLASNVIKDGSKLKVGDRVGAMTVSKVTRVFDSASLSADNVYLEFTGRVEVTGKYEGNAITGELGSGDVCFNNFDSDSLKKLPIVSNISGFCISNEDYAHQKLGSGPIMGSATIVIEGRRIGICGCEALNDAELIEVKSKK